MKTRLSFQLLVAVLLIGSTCTLVRAQSHPPSTSGEGDAISTEEAAGVSRTSAQMSIWKRNVGEQSALALSYWTLRAQVDEMVETTIQNIITLASLYDNAINLEPTVPYLLDIYERHRDEQVRIMALMALHTVGEPGSMAALDQLVQQGELSERVRALTLAALAEYHGLTLGKRKE